MNGKHDFYPKVREAFEAEGYRYFDGDTDIKGIGKSHKCKPDYIAVKKGVTVIGEIKSPAEGPESSSWRTVQNSDTEEFARVRREIAAREKAGLDKNIGGHMIIIFGQIPDYIRKAGKSYLMPDGIDTKNKIGAGYSVPESEKKNVEATLRECGKMVLEKIEAGNGTVSFVFECA